MAKIVGGSNGNVADVDDKNRLSTFSIIQMEDKNANIDGRYWSVFVSVTPAGVNDNFFYLRNDGTKDLSITDIRVSCSAITRLIYKRVIGAPVGGTPITAITNRKLGTPTVPTATIEQGVDITGLTDGGVLFFEECDEVNELQHLKTTSAIVIPQGQAVAFERVAATGAITLIVSLSEAE
jgi:hypothetical protein